MIKEIHLTKDHLKLIPFFFIQEMNDNEVSVSKEHMFNLGSHLLEDMATVLGLLDKAIPNTSDNPDGRAFEDDAEKYMLDIYHYLSDNLYYIETIIHQYAPLGGLHVGTYRASLTDLIWTFEGGQ